MLDWHAMLEVLPFIILGIAILWFWDGEQSHPRRKRRKQ
jgi:hypothetical protein